MSWQSIHGDMIIGIALGLVGGGFYFCLGYCFGAGAEQNKKTRLEMRKQKLINEMMERSLRRDPSDGCIDSQSGCIDNTQQ